METWMASLGSIWMSLVSGTSIHLLGPLQGLQPAGLPLGWRQCRMLAITSVSTALNLYPEHCQLPIYRLFLGNFSNMYQPYEKWERYLDAPRKMLDLWQTTLIGQISKPKAMLEGYYGLYRATTKMGRKETQSKRARGLPWGSASQKRCLMWLKSRKAIQYWYHFWPLVL